MEGKGVSSFFHIYKINVVPYGNEPFIFVNLKTDPAKNCSCSLNMNGELSGNDHLDREGIELVFFLLWLRGFLGFFCGSVVFSSIH